MQKQNKGEFENYGCALLLITLTAVRDAALKKICLNLLGIKKICISFTA